MKKKHYEKLPIRQKEEMEKYFPIVKKHIDKFDPIGVLPGAPEDHYDYESKKIAFQMSADCDTSIFLDVGRYVYIELASSFGIHQIKEADCLVVGAAIVTDDYEQK